MRVAGVDGCPGGWIAALVSLDGPPTVRWRLLPDASELPTLADRVGIDIPIGLPSSAVRRQADSDARARLPGRASSVFPTPVRAVLGAPDYASACEISRVVCGRAISKQTWFITPKIAEVDAVLTPAQDAVVAEVHPEVSFTLIAGGERLPSKKLAVGRARREALLATWLGRGVHALVDAAPRPARPDDALDALACAWTAWRWLRGVHEELGAGRDERGLPMRILV